MASDDLCLTFDLCVLIGYVNLDPVILFSKFGARSAFSWAKMVDLKISDFYPKWPLNYPRSKLGEYPIYTDHSPTMGASFIIIAGSLLEKKDFKENHKMTSNDPYMTFDANLWTPCMEKGPRVLLAKFGWNRVKCLGEEACCQKEERKKEERTSCASWSTNVNQVFECRYKNKRNFIVKIILCQLWALKDVWHHESHETCTCGHGQGQCFKVSANFGELHVIFAHFLNDINCKLKFRPLNILWPQICIHPISTV